MIILPNKHVPIRRSLVGIGAQLLRQLTSDMTVSELWELAEHKDDIGNFHNYVLCLDYLYLIGAIDYDNGLLAKPRQ